MAPRKAMHARKWRPSPGCRTMGFPPAIASTMPDILSQRMPEELKTLLLESAHIIAQFRRRLSDAGYPFKEPPLCDQLLKRIDSVCFTDQPNLKDKSA